MSSTRTEPEEKKHDVNPMSGLKINKEGEVRGADGNLVGTLTSLATLVGKTIDDNGYVVDNDGNKIGECTSLENIPESEPESEEQEQKAAAKAESDCQLAEKMISILSQTLDRVKRVCRQSEEVSSDPIYESRESTYTNTTSRPAKKPAIPIKRNSTRRSLFKHQAAPRRRRAAFCKSATEPPGHSTLMDASPRPLKARAASHDATPEEYQLADMIKELTGTVIKTIDNGKGRVADMPYAEKKLNTLWGLLSEPLFQIIAAVGLLLNGVLGLVGRLLDGLGLGGLLNGLLGSIGLDKLINGLGLGSLTDALGLGKK